MAATSNNIGILRLLLALLVIVGHAPEMIDDNRTREPLTLLFHTLSLGEVAVYGFFVLSGYLITKSFITTPSAADYAMKRFARIFPGYLIAYLVSVFVVAPLVGAQLQGHLLKTLLNVVLLKSPMDYPGQFEGMTGSTLLNGSLWTIAYEARCYAVVGLLGCLGLLTKKVLLGLTLLSLALVVASADPGIHAHMMDHPVWSRAAETIRLMPSFLFGATAYIWRERFLPHLTMRNASLCAVAAAALMYRNPYLATPAAVCFGGAALLWLALKANIGGLRHINESWDISYGCYLYGWPVATCLRWVIPDLSPVQLIIVTVPIALACGVVSWWGVELPARRIILGEWSRRTVPAFKSK